MTDSVPFANVTAVPAARGNGRPFAVFLSHNSRDKPAVERLAEKLKRAGLEPWLDIWSLTPGGRWQEELANGLAASSACAVFVGPAGVGDWEREEGAVAHDRAAKDRDFRLFLVLLPGLPENFDPSGLSPFLSTRTWVDLRGGIDDPDAFQSLVNAIEGIPLGPRRPIEPRNDVCPYRGLEAFGETDREFFFGRDADVQRLVEKLKATSFLAILGPSGSGKSSVALAGLVPALRAGRIPGSESWLISAFRPGEHPLDRLAATLATVYPGLALGKTRDELESDPRSLRLFGAKGGRLVWVVDQFEEVFTLSGDEHERRQFLLNLLYAAGPDGSSTVVLTMRADFYARCAGYSELAQQVASHQYLVGPLDATGLRQAIEEPARRTGLEFEPGLVSAILNDVQAQPGALPLLEHALLELWERRRGSVLTLRGYQESGGVHGALAQRADELLASFTAEQQEVARRILLRLTQPGDGTEDTRRRAELDELTARRNEGEMLEDVVRALVDARLLTTGVEPITAKETVEVSHEALIRAWPRLQGWIDEDRAGLRVQRRLTEAAREWHRLERDPSGLYRGARLLEASQWRASHDGELNDLEREFLDTSTRAEQRELEAARRRTRRLLALVAVLAVALVALAVALVYAVYAAELAKSRTDEANAQKQRALSRGLAAQAIEQLDARPDRALLLGLEAVRSDPKSAQARSALASALEQTEHALTLGAEDGSAVATTPDGRTIAVGRRDGTVTVHRSGDGARTTTVRTNGVVNVVALSPDAKLLAAQAIGREADQHIRLWDISGPKPRAISDAIPATPSRFAFDPRGNALAFSSAAYQVVLWDVSRRRLIPLGQAVGLIPSFAFSGDGTKLAVLMEERLVVWDVGERREIGRAGGDSVGVVAFGPTGRLAALSSRGRVTVWRIGRRHLERLASFETGQATSNSDTLGFGWATPSKLLVATAASGVREWTIGRAPRSRVVLAPEGTRQFAVLAVTPRSGVLVGVGLGAMEAWNLEPRQVRYGIGAALPPWLASLTHRVAASPLSRSADGKLELVPADDRGVALRRSGSTKQLRFDPDAYLATFQPHGKLVALGERNPGEITTPAPHVIVFRDLDTWARDGQNIVVTSDSNLKLARLVFSPDGSILASGTRCTNCRGDTTRLWDVRERIAIGQPLPGLPLGFSPDGTRLALDNDSAPGQIVVVDNTPWTTDLDRLERRVCGLVQRSLTADEWHAFADSGANPRTCG